jgi:tetratricopeptide (TPR) repeat protein
LPPIGVSISGLPDYSKTTAAVLGVLLGTIIFTPDVLFKLRPSWVDIPMALWCVAGVPSSLQNGLGLYDGLSESLAQVTTWGLPYLIGRIHFGDPEGMLTITTGLPVGALFYVPLCVFEMRMMTSLMMIIYGVGRWAAGTGLRFGGYRPNVFFTTGLELGLLMCAATLACWWLWSQGLIKRLGGIPVGSVLLPILLVTSILCRSSGALILMVIGTAVLWFTAKTKSRALALALLMVGPIYVGVRIPNIWSGNEAIAVAEALVGAERADSFRHRLTSENLLVAKAMQQPFFGWGGFARHTLHYDNNEKGRRVDMDGMWINILGMKGLVGLSLLGAAMLVPAVVFVLRFPRPLWGSAQLAPGLLTVTIVGLYVIDCLMNGFVNVIYMAMVGGLVGLKPDQFQSRAVRQRSAGLTSGRIALPNGAHATSDLGAPGLLAARHREIGRSMKLQGRLEAADSAWQRALDVLGRMLDANPDSQEIQRLWCDCANDLVWLRVNHPDPNNRNLKAAVPLALRLVELCPGAAEYWNTLGVTHFRAGDDLAALAALDRAAALAGGGTPFDDVFRAMAHARRGELDRATSELARAESQAERYWQGHPELAEFRSEARSILAQGANASTLQEPSESHSL